MPKYSFDLSKVIDAANTIQGITPTKATNPVPNATPSPDDLSYLAKTAYGEAEGEGDPGMTAVMSVIKNRLGKRKSWGNVQAVVQAPNQFESWDPANPRRKAMDDLDPNSDVYKHIYALAQSVMNGQTPDPTSGATLFANLKNSNPKWATKATPTAVIGNHNFFAE